jgi:hypothetical protein
MKPWLSPWTLPLVMLGIVVLFTRPVAGVVVIAASLVVVRLLNGRFEMPAADDLPRPYFIDPTRR